MISEVRADRNQPVLVVGGGTVGLTAALLLAKQNVPTVVLERHRERCEAPRAHMLNPRSLEIYRMFDFDVSAMMPHAAPPEEDAFSYFDWRTSGKQFGAIPFEEQDDTHTPHPRINIAQPQLEKQLLKEVSQTPLVDYRVGHRVIDLVSTETEAIATVVGADDQIYDIAAEGSLRSLVSDRPGMFFWSVGAKLPGVFVAYDIDRTWAYLSFVAPDIGSSAEEARATIHDALGDDRIDIVIRHVIPWVMTAQVADRFRDGRVFLVGDAAHRFPLYGGLGLNTGIQDAHNLAWKLTAVRAGNADDGLLNTYDDERRRTAEANATQSTANADCALRLLHLAENAPKKDWEAAIEGMYNALNSLALQIGFTYSADPAPHHSVQGYVPRANPDDRMPHAWCTIAGQSRSMLDLLDPKHFTLLTGHPHAIGQAQPSAYRSSPRSPSAATTACRTGGWS